TQAPLLQHYRKLPQVDSAVPLVPKDDRYISIHQPMPHTYTLSLHDALPILHEAAECGAFGDDARVVAGVGGDGDGGDAVVEVEGGDGAFAALDEFGVDGDGGDGFVVAVHVEDGVVDDLVGGPVEVGCGEVVGGVVDGVAGEEH